MIREARPGDARDLALVHVTSWQHAYADDFPTEFLETLDVDRREQWFETQIERDAGIVVAEADGSPVGFCFFGQSSDEGWGEVFAIYVHPGRWREGHGSRLLDAAESKLVEDGFDQVLLWVLETNRLARDFYERRGWVLGKPIKLEEIGGRQVTEVRYERSLRDAFRRGSSPREM